jgi:hypothetical protein
VKLIWRGRLVSVALLLQLKESVENRKSVKSCSLIGPQYSKPVHPLTNRSTDNAFSTDHGYFAHLCPYVHFAQLFATFRRKKTCLKNFQGTLNYSLERNRATLSWKINLLN